MTDEVVIVDRVQVDVEDLSKFEDYAAIPVAEPLEAVFRHTKTGEQRTQAVHGFTADRHALVLDENSGRLVRVFSAQRKNESFVKVQTLGPADGATGVRGPFTPAPPGMFAVFADGTRVPISYYDVVGRPVLIDLEPTSRALYLAQDDEAIVRIDGPDNQPDAAAGTA